MVQLLRYAGARRFVPPVRLLLETLEDRLVPSWSNPWLAMAPAPAAGVVRLDGQGDAAGAGKITATEIDWFRFTAKASGAYRIAVQTPTSDLDPIVAVYKKNVYSIEQVGYNNNVSSKDTDSNLSLTLTAGTEYYVGITNYANSPNAYGTYTWLIDGPRWDDVYEDNDGRSKASDLGVITSTQTVGGLVLADKQDWYKFRIDTPGVGTDAVSLSFSNAQGNLNVYLYNSRGALVGKSDGFNSTERIALLGKPAGTYYLKVCGYRGATNPNYALTFWKGGQSDDGYEDNDSQAQAADLGTVAESLTVGGLVLSDSADWFQFTTDTPAASGYVGINFTDALGDLDLELYDSTGSLLRSSAGSADSERVSLNGLSAGTYSVKVLGFQGATNPDYSLTVSPTGASAGGSGDHVLYLNFDGYNITRDELLRWSGTDWAWSVNEFDAEGDGVNVGAFLAYRSDREQIISQMLDMVQADLTPFGVTVQRVTGAPVEGEGATTVFLGPSTLSNGYYHVACDIDVGNDNQTDIAFVGDEDWGSASRTAIALSDVVIHEAGHTFGLYHVNSGTALETMGLRYSNDDESYWVNDTTYLDQTFDLREFSGQQDSFAVMSATFLGAGNRVKGSSDGIIDPNLTHELDDPCDSPFCAAHLSGDSQTLPVATTQALNSQAALHLSTSLPTAASGLGLGSLLTLQRGYGDGAASWWTNAVDKVLSGLREDSLPPLVSDPLSAQEASPHHQTVDAVSDAEGESPTDGTVVGVAAVTATG